MKITILPLTLLIVFVSSCVINQKSRTEQLANSNIVSPPAWAAPNANTPVSTPSFKNDVVGQSIRIQTEGITEETITKNVSEIDKTITYALLMKNSDKFIGQPWGFTGKIVEIAESGGSTAARIKIDGTSDVIYVMGPFETPFVEKDKVFVVGYIASPMTYTSQANWTISVPALAARAMMKPQYSTKYRSKNTN